MKASPQAAKRGGLAVYHCNGVTALTQVLGETSTDATTPDNDELHTTPPSRGPGLTPQYVPGRALCSGA